MEDLGPGAYVNQVNWKHAQVFVEKLDSPLIDTLGDLLAHLVRTTPLNHIKARPSVLRLGTRRGTNEERIFEFAL